MKKKHGICSKRSDSDIRLGRDTVGEIDKYIDVCSAKN